MKYEHLTPNQISTASKVGEILLWLILGIMIALWWLPAHQGEKHPIPKHQAVIYFAGLWVYFLNPITRYGFSRLTHGYKYFAQGNGSYLSLRLRVLLMAVVTTGFIYGLYISA